MPTTINDLFNIGDTVLAASQQILLSSSLYSVPIERAEGVLTTPRVELALTDFKPNGHMRPSGSRGIYDAFNGNLQCMVVADRFQNAVSMSNYVCTVYDKIGNVDEFNTRLDNHVISRIAPAGNSVRIEGDDSHTNDVTIIAFDFTIWIKANAWPT